MYPQCSGLNLDMFAGLSHSFISRRRNWLWEVDTDGPGFSCLATQDRLAVALGDKELDASRGLSVSQLTRFATVRAASPQPTH